ncbi:MAG: hypothetical protein LBR41_00545 [Rickettsiales bacterium]|jgi:hypothetical protein|nr:hypothetical protein [Rickettsiales bacterium]
MKKSPRLIVSLTSFPARMAAVERVIRGILRQTHKPDLVVLYLSKQEFTGGKTVPETLQNMVGDDFEIRWVPKTHRSYQKIIPALVDFPDDVIVTVDDDVYYPRNMIARLWRAHKKYPHDVIANRAKIISDAPYKKWKLLRWFARGASIKRLATGVGGVLYPPHALHPDAVCSDVYLDIAPTTDDLWLWAMEARQGTKIRVLPNAHILPHNIGAAQFVSLRHKNFKRGTDGNDVAWAKIMDKYPELRDIV